MGLFDFLKKKKEEDLSKRLVTKAVDPSKLPQDQVNKDLQSLGILDAKLQQSKDLSDNTNVPTSKRDASIEEALKIENPFIGK